MKVATIVFSGVTLVCAGSATAADAARIHTDALVIDAHADIVAEGEQSPYAGADGRSRVEPSKMRAGGTDAVVLAVAVSPGPRTPEGFSAARSEADRKLAVVQKLVADPSKNLVLARSADELVNAHSAGRMAVILGFQNALILGKDVAGIDHFYDQGVRIFALTHMGHNDFADSSRPLFDAATGKHEPDAEHGGLSALGKAAITRINALGAVVDVSQLSKEATLQVLVLSKAPVIASHSNVRTITHATRNLSDAEIDGIGAGGGVVHLTPFRGYLFDSGDKALDTAIRAARKDAGLPEDYLYPFELYWELKDAAVKETFLGSVSALLGPSSIDDMINHLDYVVKRIGIDHVGIGSDFNHGGGLAGFNDASEAANVTKRLLERGYSAGDVAKIWGGNLVRVLREVERLKDAGSN
ncbi:MAG: dipeptidase [Gammaproteobacteria bacterium]|nr:dipeptidase [Gammaproteobacteria bacterium]